MECLCSFTGILNNHANTVPRTIDSINLPAMRSSEPAEHGLVEAIGALRIPVAFIQA